MVEDVPWQVDLRTGEHWPVVSDVEMLEEEVEGAVRGEEVEEPMRGVETDEQIGGVEVDPLSAARELIRVEVCRTCPFRVHLSNVRNQESQPTCAPPNTPHSQVTHAPSSADQLQVRGSQEPPSVTPDRVVSNLGEEGPQQPLGTGETQTIPPRSTNPPSPGSSRGLSPVTQPPSRHEPAVTETTGGLQLTLRERDETSPAGSSRSITPTPENQRNTNTTTPLSTTSPPPRDPWSGPAEPPRHGKGKRLEPYSDEGEEVVDVPMEDHNDFTSHEQ